MTLEHSEAKDARLAARVSPKLKKLFEHAAQIEGRSLTDYMIQTLKDRSEEIIEKHEILSLSQRDRELFFRALLNPPAPNKKLHSAMADFRKSQKH
jgi:uncharacterized protein (DUF1778 family)